MVRGPLAALALALLVGALLSCTRSDAGPTSVPRPSLTPDPGVAVATGTPGLSSNSLAPPTTRPDGTPARSAAGGDASPTPSLIAATTGASVQPRPYGCPASPCPRSLEYAVNGCDCAGQVYTESSVSAGFCCAAGFSDSECAESLAEEARLEATFGATQSEVEDQLVTVELGGWPARVHRAAAPAFRQVAERLRSVDYKIVEPVESYNWRVVEGHRVLSNHAFGIAVDINPSTNPNCGVTRSCHCLNDLITDMPADFVQAFKDAGFDWGGDWSDHPDPMHFEWAGWQ
jgi:hypothetical protein